MLDRVALEMDGVEIPPIWGDVRTFQRLDCDGTFYFITRGNRLLSGLSLENSHDITDSPRVKRILKEIEG